jgi:hypothetical protein
MTATGTALGAARALGDEALFERLSPPVQLVGAPVDAGDRRAYALGGAPGHAMMFAMLTAQPAGK